MWKNTLKRTGKKFVRDRCSRRASRTPERHLTLTEEGAPRRVRKKIFFMPNGAWCDRPGLLTERPAQGAPRAISMPPESNASSDWAQVRPGQ